ncbi:hypothetical protein [Actinomadura xylanilytica]|uniref:hypothetical protein n=1 Tax=Actinomadura xylanilytica TaxID=887459 RepID=UPI00255AFDE7|nr:hypothetical protein [Actinomadura xylanilytica]MDL4772846.1 hypothetical protein [Actinomadura xylanilytica]
MGAWEAGPRLCDLTLETGSGAALTLSAMGVPGGWPFVSKFYCHQYDPKVFWDGATAWWEVAKHAREAREQVHHLVDGVAEDAWRSEDGRAFAQRMDRFLDDLHGIEIRACAVAGILMAAAGVLIATILFMALLAAVLAALAAWVVIATITPVSAAMARATAIMTLANMFASASAVETNLTVFVHACAGALGLLVAGDVFVAATKGDFSGVTDFAKATVSRGPLLIWGTANRVERDATSYGLQGHYPAEGLYGRIAGGRAGQPLPAGFTHAAGAKTFNETQYGNDNQTITGNFTPSQNEDGSYPYPWD